MREHHRWAAAAVVPLAVLIGGCTAPAVADSPAAASMAAPTAQVGPTGTFALLDTLEVKGRAPKTGFSRDKFGQAWSDDVAVEYGHDGIDTRNNLLSRDLTNKTFKPGTRDRVVTSGTLQDPYTGKIIQFTRGENSSSAIQIDHVVALSNAWQTGAQQLDEQTRRDFANDPRNLLAVDGPANQQKSDGDAATWLPANKAYRCTYVTKQVEVKAAYHLWVTPPEKDAIVRILKAC